MCVYIYIYIYIYMYMYICIYIYIYIYIYMFIYIYRSIYTFVRGASSTGSRHQTAREERLIHKQHGLAGIGSS